mmetsp:Transcript_46179/g.124007  ORF Transcript_46179/g.124007 Transcript_46179/m.124007 type:complete len:210 (-) Transcript_46179:78-707(-)
MRLCKLRHSIYRPLPNENVVVLQVLVQQGQLHLVAMSGHLRDGVDRDLAGVPVVVPQEVAARRQGLRVALGSVLAEALQPLPVSVQLLRPHVGGHLPEGDEPWVRPREARRSQARAWRQGQHANRRQARGRPATRTCQHWPPHRSPLPGVCRASRGLLPAPGQRVGGWIGSSTAAPSQKMHSAPCQQKWVEPRAELRARQRTEQHLAPE